MFKNLKNSETETNYLKKSTKPTKSYKETPFLPSVLHVISEKKKKKPDVVTLLVVGLEDRWCTKGSLCFGDLVLNQFQTTEKYSFVAAKVQE